MHAALAFLLGLPASLANADMEAPRGFGGRGHSMPSKMKGQQMQRAFVLLDSIRSYAQGPPLLVVWAHFPKCGSSFMNSLIRLKGTCDLPEDFVVDERMGPKFLRAFKPTASVRCPGLVNTTFGHYPLASRVDMEVSAGHFMGMLREPVSRLQSAYLDMVPHHLHSIPIPEGACMSWGGWPNESLPTFTDFARVNGGCMVKMLAWSGPGGCPCSWSGDGATEAELALAKQRLRRHFAFVGILEEWRLSVCLLDRMFGTGCHSAQFKQARRHLEPKPPAGDAADPMDSELYEEARRIFRENLLRYDVTERSCQPCYLRAGVPL